MPHPYLTFLVFFKMLKSGLMLFNTHRIGKTFGDRNVVLTLNTWTKRSMHEFWSVTQCEFHNIQIKATEHTFSAAFSLL